jgi:hypothetical protein
MRYRPPAPPTQTVAHEIGSPLDNPRLFQITLPMTTADEGNPQTLDPLKEIHRYIPDIAIGTEHPSGTTERVAEVRIQATKISKLHKRRGILHTTIVYTVEVHYAVYDIEQA